MDGGFVTTSVLILAGFFWLVVWFLKKLVRGEISLGGHTALLVLLAAILLVPFAMNFSAHLISTIVHHPGATEDPVPQPGDH